MFLPGVPGFVCTSVHLDACMCRHTFIPEEFCWPSSKPVWQMAKEAANLSHKAVGHMSLCLLCLHTQSSASPEQPHVPVHAPLEPSALTLMICLWFLPPPCFTNTWKGNTTESNTAFAALLLGSLKHHLLEEPGTGAIHKSLTASYSTSTKIARKRTRANINC